MEIRSTEEARENTETFAKRFVNLLQEKKDIDENIKLLKTEFKEEGVAVGVVVKAINQIKAQKKMSPADQFEIDAVREWLEASTEIDDKIGELIAE